MLGETVTPSRSERQQQADHDFCRSCGVATNGRGSEIELYRGRNKADPLADAAIESIAGEFPEDELFFAQT
jgi:hypothetical protein